jgi:hypothetical protein
MTARGSPATIPPVPWHHRPMRTRCVLLATCLLACGGAPPPSTTSASTATVAGAPGGSDPDARSGQARAGDALEAPGPSRSPGANSPPASPGGAGHGELGGDVWHDCVKDFVEAQKESARAQLIDALSVYSTTCDKFERHVAVAAPLSMATGHDYSLDSHVSFGAHLAKAGSKVWLSAAYHGGSWIYAERIKIAADEFRWTSPRLAFSHDDSSPIWEHAELPYTKALQPIIRRIIEAKDVTIRFEGPRSNADLIVTPEMKQDLKLMMDALSAIKIP